MDKETIEDFLMPFDSRIPIKLRFEDGRIVEFNGINYGFENEGDGVIYLECSAVGKSGV